MTTMTPEEIRRELGENARAPHGTARNLHAEALAAAAEATGDRELFRRALVGLIEAYEYSAERTKMVVPFARLLQEYDRDQGVFTAREVHRLFWRFKWVAGRIVESPEIPLSAVDGWLTDMERRYRLAGYSERAVRQAEFYLADATGDHARMERAITGWAAAERDSMSDCHACEINTQGWYWARKGDDAKAIEVWQPVLADGLGCMEEPHRVLAHALLPLVRLGRTDEARTYHLRGYRMARGKESLLRSVGEHIEFCALTGNESRGLEILAEHAGHLGPLADVESQMEFAGGVLVLLRRLTDLGHGDGPTVAYQGEVRSAKELYEALYTAATDIAARFDARNGTALVSQRLVDRIGQKPLVGALPLGVRSAELPSVPLHTQTRPDGAETRPAAGDLAAGGTEPDLAALVGRARAARQQGHPSAQGLWAEAARIAEAGGEGTAHADLSDPALAGDLLVYRAATAASSGDPGARSLYAEAAASYRAAGQHSRASHAELAIAGCATQFDAGPAEIRELLAAALGAAEALDEADPERLRRLVGAELTALRIESHLRERAADEPESPVDDRLVAELEGFVAAYGDEPAALTAGPGSVADLVADSELLLAKLALVVDDLDRSAPLLDSAARRLLAAEHPWDAVEPLSLLAGVLAARGELEAAESTARTALDHAAELADGADQAGVRLTLADILLRRGEAGEAVPHALEATHWLDQAGLAATSGARARLLLARAYAAAERIADAAEVLQSALPDLLEHGEGEGVEARELLGGLLRELHDPRAAAEQYLLAAETAKGWDEPRFEAGLAHSAGEALAAAHLRSEAEAAYGRSLELWRCVGGNPVAEVRVLRSLAWLAVGDQEDEESAERIARARDLMEQALAVVDGSEEPGMRYERAQTWQQLARLLQGTLPEDEEEDESSPEARATREQMVGLFDRATGLYTEFGEDALDERFQCVAHAAWTESELGRAESATARVSALITELAAWEGDRATDLKNRAEMLLDQLR
ncbi:tetratricopeptide repeat protein [Streptomyces sp. NPDC058620]|uniref:tetratricopeptide repeat protein n=1 Tax=Streptomyces sp. NPDC058620 TaxID=3346560 RepID=UPI0036586441